MNDPVYAANASLLLFNVAYQNKLFSSSHIFHHHVYANGKNNWLATNTNKKLLSLNTVQNRWKSGTSTLAKELTPLLSEEMKHPQLLCQPEINVLPNFVTKDCSSLVKDFHKHKGSLGRHTSKRTNVFSLISIGKVFLFLFFFLW